MLAINGRIYNYRELRALTPLYPYRGGNDTEVVLGLYKAYGTEAFRKLRGMFAIAICDSRVGKTTLFRDHFGIKSLYCGPFARGLAFARQVKALVAGGYGNFSNLDELAVEDYFYWGSVRGQRKVGVHALQSGGMLILDLTGLQRERWFAPNLYVERARTSWTASLRLVRETVRQPVAFYLRGDVPSMLSFSGGVDSTSLLAAALLNATPVTTGSPTFPNSSEDESQEIAKILKAVPGSEHVSMAVQPTDLEGHIRDFSTAQDQLSAGGQNTFVVSEPAHDPGFKVGLFGLGGDEVSVGYRTARRTLLPVSARVRPKRLLGRALRSLGGLRFWPSGERISHEQPTLFRRSSFQATLTQIPAIGAAPLASGATTLKLALRHHFMEDMPGCRLKVLLRGSDNMLAANSLELRGAIAGQYGGPVGGLAATSFPLAGQKHLLGEACLGPRFSAVACKAEARFQPTLSKTDKKWGCHSFDRVRQATI